LKVFRIFKHWFLLNPNHMTGSVTELEEDEIPQTLKCGFTTCINGIMG
tara:strand:- start:356 stop:499 length:144 start_codon:yes stop_codon:yes gene_type:complete